ncbi:MAG: alpha/beta hydrolase, partial [Bifidobacterium pseudocatenulatum]
IVIAADQLGDDSHNTLCVDSPVYGKALTYLTKDVVDWVKTNLPAAQQAQDWAIAGFSQGATCSLQIGANHPDLFGTIIPTGSELKPTNGSESSMISRFFHGDRTAYEKQIPINAIRNHAPSNQTLVIGAGEHDRESVRNVERIAPVAQQAGMHVTAVESLTMRMTGMPCKTRCGTACRIRLQHGTERCQAEIGRLSESQTHFNLNHRTEVLYYDAIAGINSETIIWLSRAYGRSCRLDSWHRMTLGFVLFITLFNVGMQLVCGIRHTQFPPQLSRVSFDALAHGLGIPRRFHCCRCLSWVVC